MAAVTGHVFFTDGSQAWATSRCLNGENGVYSCPVEATPIRSLGRLHGPEDGNSRLPLNAGD